MPLHKLQLQPGINREGTALSTKGMWYDCDKVRFRSGLPEKIGGWDRDTGTYLGTLEPPTGIYWGVARALWNWILLEGNNLLGIGSHLKYTLQNGVSGNLYDITPLRETTAAGDVTFAAVNGSTELTVTDNSHGAAVDDFVTFSGAVTLGGAVTAVVLNTEYQVASVIDGNTYTVTLSVAATVGDVGNGGAAVVGAYQIATGAEIDSYAFGWGAGVWNGSEGWGEAASASTVAALMRLWSHANYGDYLLINPRGGPIYMWVPVTGMTSVNRAELLDIGSAGAYQTDVDCPTTCNLLLVSYASRFVLTFGVNDYGSATLDPLLIRWCEQENYTIWTPAATNQAGSYRLSNGTGIVAALQTRQEVLVWTDAALYSMQYLGPPYVWGVQILGDNISIMSSRAMVTADNITYWMGRDKFYAYSGRVDTLPCTVRKYVFSDMNIAQRGQFFAGTNEGFNEVWWYYCSAESTVVDRYVIYNYLERVWYYGTLGRTAWLDSAARNYPMSAGYSGSILYHETGVDDGSGDTSVGMESHLWSSDIDIEDGDHFGFIWRMVPDVSFDGSTSASPEITLTVSPRRAPGSDYTSAAALTEPQSGTVVSANSYVSTGTYLIQQFTEQIFPRARGRSIRFGVSSDALGTQWRWGHTRVDIRPDGRR